MENKLKSSGHVERKYVEYVKIRVNQMENGQTTRGSYEEDFF